MKTYAIAVGARVVHEHKGRRSWGIVAGLTRGMFDELRVSIDWCSGDGSPFPVPIEDCEIDNDGVVAGTLKCA